MSDLIKTIETEIATVAGEIEKGILVVGKEALAIIKGVAGNVPAELLNALKETSVGTAILNGISAVKAANGDVLAALPAIIEDGAAELKVLASEGGFIAGIEKELTGVATALAHFLVAQFEANGVAGPIIAAVRAL